jgi:alpha-tubulin suppressor-like RCC1 family protein
LILHSKKYITGKVIEIAAYAERFFVLTECGDLYGWGDTSFLGLKLKNCNEELIGYIVNPLKLLGNIRLMAPGGNHCVVITKDGVVKGWGDISCFT